MKKVNQEVLVNWWLEKFHNTNLDKVLEDHPDWKENPREHTRDLYLTYQVTQEQSDEWEKWAKDYIKKETKCGKKLLEHDWPWIFLDTAPQVIKNNK